MSTAFIVLFLAKNSHTSSDVGVGALSRCRIKFILRVLVAFSSSPCLRTALKSAFIFSLKEDIPLILNYERSWTSSA